MKKIVLLCSIAIIMAKANLINKDYTNYKDQRIEKRKDLINNQIESFKNLDKKEQLIQVNLLFNKYIKYESDQNLYKKYNYIARLEETILTMKGDCDDYVLAKLQALDYLGFKENKIFFNTENGVRHVKIITKLDNIYYVLDSLNKKFRELTPEELKEENIKIYNASIYLQILKLREA